jgi:hypothetical protein
MDSQSGSAGKYADNNPTGQFGITHDQYLANRNGKTRETANQSNMDKPFWKYMIVKGGGGFDARQRFNNDEDIYPEAEFEDMKNPD